MKKTPSPKPISFIRKRCPHLKGKKLLEAEELFRDYLRICLEISDRLEREERAKNIKRPDEQRGFDKNTEDSTMKKED